MPPLRSPVLIELDHRLKDAADLKHRATIRDHFGSSPVWQVSLMVRWTVALSINQTSSRPWIKKGSKSSRLRVANGCLAAMAVAAMMQSARERERRPVA